MNILDKLEGKLVVSCQALDDEPLHSSYIMSKMALAAKQGGASAIRAQGTEDIIAIRKECGLPVIGIIKREYKDSDIHITPSLKEVEELLKTDCEIIALDATPRQRPNREKLETLLKKIHEAGILAMGDISTIEEAVAAEKLGFDCVGTTLSGYTDYSPQKESVDFELIEAMSKKITIPIIAEGKIQEPKDLVKAFDLGADIVVVGGAITRPQQITERFVRALEENKHN